MTTTITAALTDEEDFPGRELLGETVTVVVELLAGRRVPVRKVTGKVVRVYPGRSIALVDLKDSTIAPCIAAYFDDLHPIKKPYPPS